MRVLPEDAMGLGTISSFVSPNSGLSMHDQFAPSCSSENLPLQSHFRDLLMKILC